MGTRRGYDHIEGRTARRFARAALTAAYAVDLRRVDHLPGRLRLPRGCQKIERVPLDERLGLPGGDFSYVLEDWGQRLCPRRSRSPRRGSRSRCSWGCVWGPEAAGAESDPDHCGHAPSFRRTPWRRLPRRVRKARCSVVTCRAARGVADAPARKEGRSQTVASPPDQGREGEQEADGLCGSSVQH